MKHKIYLNSVLALNAIALCTLLGCAPPLTSREYVSTEEGTKGGKHWATTEVVQEYYDRHGKVIKDRQVIYEKEKCVAQDGRSIQAATVKECVKKGGRIVNVIQTEEEIIQRRR